MHASTTPIGIDLDYNEFRAIQFNSHGIPTAVATIPRNGRRRLSPTANELQDLANALAQRGFVGNRIALAVPKRHSSFHILDLPPEGSGAPINKLALLEAQRSGAHKTPNLQVGFWTLPKKDAQSKSNSPYYTVAAELDPLNDLIDEFEAVDLLPVSVEPIETALLRSASTHEELTEDSIHSIVEIGWDQSWVVITLGAIPVYSRTIEFGTSRIRRQLIDDHAMPSHAINSLINTHIPDNDTASKVDRIITSLLTPMLTQIVDQLDTALTYVSQQHRFAPFGVVFRSGYFSNHDQTARAIAQRTGMPTIELQSVHHVVPDYTAPVTPFELAKSPRLNIAAGLAQGAAA